MTKADSMTKQLALLDVFFHGWQLDRSIVFLLYQSSQAPTTSDPPQPVKRLTWKEPNSWGLRKFFGEKCRWNVSGVQNRRSMSTWWDDVWNLTTMVRCFICKLITWPSKCIQTRLDPCDVDGGGCLEEALQVLIRDVIWKASQCQKIQQSKRPQKLQLLRP